MKIGTNLKRVRPAFNTIRTVARETQTPIARVVRKSLSGVTGQILNKCGHSHNIKKSWNNPKIEPFDWPQWATEWSEAFEGVPEISGGNWSDTVFCSGFLHSGSSAIADCLYDSLNVPKPPSEIVAFRDPWLPSLMQNGLTLQNFMLQCVLGVSPNPRHHQQAWINFAVTEGFQNQIFPSSIIETTSNKLRLSAARLAHAYLAPSNQLLVLDNALYREHTLAARHYQDSTWIMVLRDLPSQYAQLTREFQLSWSVAEFCDFIEASVSQTIANLSPMLTYWVSFDNFVLDAQYRQKVVSLVKPSLMATSRHRFDPEQSKRNTRLGGTLPLRDRLTLAAAEKQIYGRVEFS